VTLRRIGVNDVPMGYLARFELCGLNVPLSSQRIMPAGK
jgi:hypothetical protein